MIQIHLGVRYFSGFISSNPRRFLDNPKEFLGKWGLSNFLHHFSEPLQLFPTGEKKWKFVQGLRRLAKSIDEPFSMKPHPLSLLLRSPARRRELASINSRFGSLIHSQSYGFRKRAVQRFEKEVSGPPLPPEIDSGSYSPYKIKEGYRAIRFR